VNLSGSRDCSKPAGDSAEECNIRFFPVEKFNSVFYALFAANFFLRQIPKTRDKTPAKYL
jgi:hypothetical protein